MSALLASLLSNALTATLLALLVGALGLFRLRPTVLHAMWLIVLLKFVTPPLLSVPLPSKLPWPVRWPQTEVASSTSNIKPAQFSAVGTASSRAIDSDATTEPGSASGRVPVDHSPRAAEADGTHSATASFDVARRNKTLAAPRRHLVKAMESPSVTLVRPDHVDCPPSGAPINEQRLKETLRSRISDWLPSALAMIWVVGSAAWFILAGVRLVQFHRRIRGTRLADRCLQNVADEVANRMRLRVRPLLRITDATLPPMLTSLPRGGVVLLPSKLMQSLHPSQQAGIIAHELAHFRRGDHWTRWLEFLVVGLYWWHPVAWFARRQLQKAEEFCCDAWVLRVFPDQARGYAQALLATVDFLSEVRTPAPAGASGFGHAQSLQRRLDMILKRTVRPELSSAARMAVLGVALGVLPWAPQAFSQSAAKSPATNLPKAEASPPAASAAGVEKPTKPTTEERLDRLEQMVGSLVEMIQAERERDVKGERPAAKKALGQTKSDAEATTKALRERMFALNEKVNALKAQLKLAIDERESTLSKWRAEYALLNAEIMNGAISQTARGSDEHAVDGRNEKLAFVGLIDLDDDGVSDRDVLHGIVMDSNAVIVDEVDDKGQRTPPQGRIDVDTKFLVVGKIPKVTGSKPHERKAHEQIALWHKTMMEEAREHGVRIISLHDFLSHIGYEPSRRISPPGKSQGTSNLRGL
jgi:beta-lactamase regulating signal transducer with metallopeptidase domain